MISGGMNFGQERRINFSVEILPRIDLSLQFVSGHDRNFHGRKFFIGGRRRFVVNEIFCGFVVFAVVVGKFIVSGGLSFIKTFDSESFSCRLIKIKVGLSFDVAEFISCGINDAVKD